MFGLEVIVYVDSERGKFSMESANYTVTNWFYVHNNFQPEYRLYLTNFMSAFSPLVHVPE